MYINMNMISNEKVFPERDGFQCHASSFIQLSDGRMMCVFFGGTRESASDVCIWGSVRECDGTWSDIVKLTEDDDIPHWNPVLLKCSNGKIKLFYKVGRPIADWYTKAKTIEDENIVNGKNPLLCFGDSAELVPDDITGGRGPVKNKAVYLSNGDILAPGSTEKGEWKAFFDLSSDNGITWKRSDDVRLNRNVLSRYEDIRGKGIIQPSVWESGKNQVHALMRSSEGFLFRTDSEDGGKTWSSPYQTGLPNNNSGIDLVKLSDGNLAIAYNPVSDNWGKRTPLSLAVSLDNGITWEKKLDIVTEDGEYSYPAIQFYGGKIYVSYTWNRRSIGFAEIEMSKL